ncbi:large ribosomal subunit protein uL2x-like [Miscanthus floridulus]|uniref:large ribosomal subunit protein uL2x-like n=1 Tax=Miscanthus floridulus TaxID=154761 RepID=UPI003458D141
MYTDQFIYCGRCITLSIGDAPPLRWIFDSVIICDNGHHTGDNGASTGTPRNYAIVASRDPDNGASTRTPRDNAIIVSRNPNNSIGRRPLLSTGEPRHLIYVG